MAVAVRYDETVMQAPTVVAKGEGWLAEKIRQVAMAHAVPLVQRPPLARSLYQTVACGQQIPEKLYRAVAEVLAYIYQMKERVGGRV